MSFGSRILETRTAGASLASDYGLCMVFASAAMTRQASDGGIVHGICQSTPASGEAGEVCTFGLCEAMAGDTITDGAKLKVEATTGRVVPYTGTSEHCIGTAREAGVDGQLIKIFFTGVGTTVS